MQSLQRAGRWWVVLWAALMVGLGALYLTVAVSPDQALFDYIAWSHLQGDVYYAGVAEQNWPGKMLLHEAGIRLFGVHFWTFRAVDFLLLLGLSGMGALFLQRAGFTLAPVLFLFLYPTLYVTAGDWQAGQRDIIAAGMLVAAAAMHLRRTTTSPFLTGALIALAVLIRPTYLSYLLGVLVLEWLRFPGEAARPVTHRISSSLTLLAGFAGPVGVILAGGLALGALDDFYQQSILFNVEVYQVAEARSRLVAFMMADIARDWHWITLLATLGLALWIAARGLSRGLVLILGMIATVLLSYFVQNKGFGYHLGGLLTAMTILVSLALDQLNRLRRAATSAIGRNLALTLLVLSAALCLAGSGKKLSNYAPNAAALMAGDLRPFHNSPDQVQWDDVSRAVTAIRANSAPDDFVLQWGRAFQIPYLAERRSTLRFLSSPASWLERPAFSAYDDWLAEVRAALHAKPPRFAIVDRQVLTPGPTVQPHAGAGPVERLVIGALADYRIVQQAPSFVLLAQP